MDITRIRSSPGFEMMAEALCDPFVCIVQNFYSSKSLSSLSDLTSSVYSFPMIQREDYFTIIRMRKDGKPIQECCAFLKNYFQFDPAYVGGCILRQFTEFDCKLGLQANAIAWLARWDSISSDFFSLIATAILNFLLASDDEQIVFLLKNLIEFYANKGFTDINSEVVLKVSAFASAKLLFAHDSSEMLLNLLKIALQLNNNVFTDLILNGLINVVPADTRVNSQAILKAIEPLFLNFDEIAFRLFQEVTQYNYNAEYYEILEKLVHKIVHILQELSISQIEFEPQTIFEDKAKVSDVMNVQPSLFHKLSIGMALPSPDAFDSRNKYHQNLSENRSLKMFEKLFSNLPENLTTSVLSMFSILMDDAYSSKGSRVRIIIYLIHIMLDKTDTPLPDNLVQYICESQIFHPYQNVFLTNPSEMKHLSAFRNDIITVFLANHPTAIVHLLNKCINSLLLYTEIVARIQAHVSFNEMPSFLTSHTIRNFTVVIFCLLQHIPENPTETDCYYRAWSTLFYFLISILDDFQIAEILLLQNHFTTLFTAHIFQRKLAPMLKNTLNKFFSQKTCPNLDTVFNFVNFATSVFTYASMNQRPYEEVVLDVLDILSTAVTHNPSTASTIASIVPITFTHLANFPSTSLLQAVLSMVLCISMSVDDFEFTKPQIVQLDEAIKKTEPDGTSEQTQLMLISILAQSKSANNTSMFLIHAPAFIILLLSASSSDLAKIIVFFDKLIKFSIYNCIQCHNGGLDLFIIDMLKNYPNSFTFNGWNFPMNVTEEQLDSVVFPLIRYMFLTKTSLIVVERFVSLAVPTKEEKYPELAEQVITKLNQTLTSAPRLPKLTIAFSNNSPIFDYPSIPSAKFQNGCTFVFQCMFDSALTSLSSAQPMLLHIFDDEDNEILVFANGTTLFCEIHSEGQASAANLYNNFEPCKWAFCVLIFHPRGDQMRVQFSVNGEQPSLFHVRNPTFNKETIHCVVGGFKSNVAETSPFTFLYLGPYMLLDVTFSPTDILRMYSGEIQQPEGTNNLTPLQEDWTQESVFHTIKIISERSDFFSVLVPFFKFHSFAPPHFLERVADILQHIPKESTFNYYPVVANYLYTLPSESLTYQFYSRFVPLGSNLPSVDLLTHILFNVDLWITAPAQQLVRIASHWSTVLASGFISVFKRTYTVAQLVTMLRVYLYYEPIETEIISTRPRAPDLDVAQVRQCMDKLIFALAKVNLSQKDVQTIVSHAFTVQDTKQIPDILGIIKSIAPLIKNGDKIAYQLHFLFIKSKDPNILVGTLHALVALCNGNIAQHVELILFYINVLHINKPTLDFILELCTTNPEIFPIAAFIASRLDDIACQAFAVVFSDTVIFQENAQKLVKVKAWYAFPIICAIFSPISIPAICSALFAILNSNWHFSVFDELCIFVDRLGFAGYPIKELRNHMLNKLVDYSLEKKFNGQALTNVVMRASRYLLFAFVPYIHASILMNAYKTSIFGENQDLIVPNTAKISILDIYDMMKNPSCNLIFRVDSTFSKDLLLKVSKLSSLIPQSSNSTASVYIDFFDYFASRDGLSEEAKYARLMDLTPKVHQLAMVMNLSYQEFFSKQCTSDYKYLEYLKGRAEEIQKIDDSFVSISSNATSICHGANENMICVREVKTAKFSETHMNENSVWAGLQPQLEERLSSVICHPFVAPLYKLVGPRPKKRRILTVVGKPLFLCDVLLVKIKGETKASFALFPDCVLFKSTHKEIKINLNELIYVLHRTRRQKLTCLEFVKNDFRSYLVDFAPKNLKNILPRLAQLNGIPNCIVQFQLYPIFFSKRDLTNEWVNGRISNFEYLMYINFFGGHTLKWASSYPILPNIFADKYGNLDDKATYRDFRRQKHYAIRPTAWLRAFPPYSVFFEGKGHTCSVTSADSTGLHVVENVQTDESECFSESRVEETDDDLSELEISMRDPVELVPEFFTSPDCFQRQEQNPIEFVRRMRKGIESPWVTSQLHIWIDQVFGVDQQQSSRTPQIFSVPHPARALPRLTVADKAEKSFRIPATKIVRASIESDGNGGYVIRGFSTDIGSFEYRGGQLTIINKSTDPRLVFIPFQGGCAIVNNQDASATLYSNREMHLISPVPEAHFYGTGSMYGACAGLGGCAYLLDGKTNQLFGMCHVSPECPTCIFSSDYFKITAVGVKSGSVIFYDLVRGTHIRSIKLGFTPNRIIITRGVGRLVVFGLSDFVIANLRGEILIQKTTSELLGCDITAVCSCNMPAFSPYMNEDCVLIADAKRRVIVIDAMEGTIIGDQICTLSARPACVGIIEEPFGAFTIAAIGEDGKVITHSIPSLKL